MVNIGDIVLCTKEWEDNPLTKGQLGLVKKIVTSHIDDKFYWIEFFNNVKGHGRFGKDGHCWIVGEEAVVKAEEGKRSKEVFRNLVF